jgi:hypothetical protein
VALRAGRKAARREGRERHEAAAGSWYNRRMARVGTKLMLAVLTGGVALLAAEGVVSLATNRSLARRLCDGHAGLDRLPDSAPHALTAGDEDRRKAALANPGLYRVHRDPLVGYVLKTDADLQILDGKIRSDHLGLRSRPAGAIPEGAVRLVVLGDSVAFGYGLNDEQTLAQQLEDQLAAVRGPSLPPVAGRTVAMPGWNHRNAVHCLLDHIDELDPDIVVYLPVGNDLIDGDGIWETGHRRSAPDVASSDPWLQVGVRTEWPFLETLRAEVTAGRLDPAEVATRVGPALLNSDLPAESRRRFDENAASIALLARTLEARGSQLLLVPYVESEYDVHLLRHLRDASLDVPTLRLFQGFPREFGLADDLHPNAAAVGVMATWIAEELLRRGWVERGAGGALPPVGAQYTALRSDPLDVERIVAASDARRAEVAAQLRPALDFTTFEGIYQVYGTLNDDASVAMRLLVGLQPAGGHVLVRLAPLESRPELYPLEVGVEIDGRAVGSVVVTKDGPAEGRWPVPDRADVGAPLEVRLKPERWTLVPQGNSTTLASFRPLRIACEP